MVKVPAVAIKIFKHDKSRSRISTIAAGLPLLGLVTGLSEVMARIPMVVLAGIMVIVAAKTVNWHSLHPPP